MFYFYLKFSIIAMQFFYSFLMLLLVITITTAKNIPFITNVLVIL